MVIKPLDFEVDLLDCPPGFFVFEGRLCLKTEYGRCEIFNSAGETFWGGTSTNEDRHKLKVIPAGFEWREIDS